MHPKWISKFELKPGRWVFHPSDEARAAGGKIKEALEDRWEAPLYYFHLRAGGHVEALKAHLASSIFARLDIHDFFGSINRSRVTRCLKPHFGYKVAREMANDSTVRHPKDDRLYILPFGFVQSPILASVALFESSLGICLERMSKMAGVVVSVYVDDIIISNSDEAQLKLLVDELNMAAEKAKFTLSEEKQEGPAASITAFNIDLSQGHMELEAMKLQEFNLTYTGSSNLRQKEGISGYVRSVNPGQATMLGA